MANAKVTKIDSNRIADDVVEQEFSRFVDMMDLDLDDSLLDDEDKAALAKQKNRILKAISRGSLVFNDDGEAVYTPTHSRSKYKEAITFHEHSGASIMAIDGKGAKAKVAATHAILADMCKVPPKVFAGLVGVDYKVCTALFALLMD